MIENTTLEIEGMSCGHCVNAVKNLIQELNGIESVHVNLSSKQADVSYNPTEVSAQAIITNINSSNSYKATEK
jgi:copper chaperone